MTPAAAEPATTGARRSHTRAPAAPLHLARSTPGGGALARRGAAPPSRARHRGPAQPVGAP